MRKYGPGLVCPACGGETAVTDSRGGDAFIRRRRKCKSCAVLCSTIEVAVPVYQRGSTLPSEVTRAMALGVALDALSERHREIVTKLIAVFSEEKQG